VGSQSGLSQSLGGEIRGGVGERGVTLAGTGCSCWLCVMVRESDRVSDTQGDTGQSDSGEGGPWGVLWKAGI